MTFVVLDTNQFKDWGDSLFIESNGFKKWSFKMPAAGVELVACASFKRLPNFEAHVYTTLGRDGKTRAKGEDAIRIILYDVKAGKAVKQYPKVLRTEGGSLVFDRVTERIITMLEDLPSFTFCKKCGSHLVERVNRTTEQKFMACSAYPNCGKKPIYSLIELDENKRQRTEATTIVHHVDVIPAKRHENAFENMTPLVTMEDCYPNTSFPHFRYGFEKFNRLQSTILQHGYWNQDCNLVLGTATSTGKTIAGELFVWETLKVHKKKVCYVSPLKSLTLEKFNDWSKSFGNEYKICILTGDFVLTDERAKELNEADLICLTSEMIDSYPYETELFCYKDGKVWKDSIGRLVEENIDCEIFSYHEGKGVLPTEITGRIKIDPKNIYKVSLIGGRSVEMTECHNLFILDKETGEIKTKLLKDIDIQEDQIAISTGFKTISKFSIIPFAELLLDLKEVKKERTFFSSPEISEALSDHEKALELFPLLQQDPEYLSKTKQRINDWKKRGCLPITILENSIRNASLDMSKVSKIRCYHSKLELPAIIDVDNELAWALGFFVSDGSCLVGNRLSFDQKNDNLQFLERAQKVFGGSITSKIDTRPGLSGIIHHLDIPSVLWKYVGFLFGGYSRDKFVPDFVFTWEAEKIESFLQGMLCGDGFIDNSDKDRHMFRTSSFQLAKDIQNLVLLIGRYCFITKNSKKETDLMWNIQLNENNPNKRNNLHPYLHFIKIKSIDFLRKDYVYDLEVQPDNISYSIQNWIGGQGGLVLHNSRTRNHSSEKSDWIFQVGLIITDESHIISTERGHAVEAGLMRFCKLVPSARVLMLSATMPNVSEFKVWLTNLNGKQTEVINNSWRPTVLEWYFLPYATYGATYQQQQDSKQELTLNCLNIHPDEKALVFVHDKNTGRQLEAKLTHAGIDCKFHNADLELKDRIAVETSFESQNENSLRVLISTSTLAWGRNLPAVNVIIVGVTRGLSNVDDLDIIQMAGRAGRLGWSDVGRCYLICDNTKAWEYKVNHPRNIVSTLLNEDILGFHVLAEIANNEIWNKESLIEWFTRSLASIQIKLDDSFVERVLKMLVDIKMLNIDGNGVFTITTLGRISASLYFYPRDVYHWACAFSNLENNNLWKSDLAISYALGTTPSWQLPYVPKNDATRVLDYTESIMDIVPELTNGKAMQSVVATDLYDLITEQSGAHLHARQIRNDIDRIIGAISWIDSVHGWGAAKNLRILSIRIKNGVRAGLAEFCEIPGIGAVRAKKLQAAGIKDLKDLINNTDKVYFELGKTLAPKVIENAKKIIRANIGD